MPPKKYALKGEPDFHHVGDEKVKSFLNMTQELIFCYKGYADEKVTVLQEIWKDLSVEHTARLCNSPDVVVASAPLLKKVPRIRKSPAKR